METRKWLRCNRIYIYVYRCAGWFFFVQWLIINLGATINLYYWYIFILNRASANWFKRYGFRELIIICGLRSPRKTRTTHILLYFTNATTLPAIILWIMINTRMVNFFLNFFPISKNLFNFFGMYDYIFIINPPVLYNITPPHGRHILYTYLFSIASYIYIYIMYMTIRPVFSYDHDTDTRL